MCEMKIKYLIQNLDCAYTQNTNKDFEYIENPRDFLKLNFWDTRIKEI